jgi:hypothetical protein
MQTVKKNKKCKNGCFCCCHPVEWLFRVAEYDDPISTSQTFFAEQKERNPPG